MKTQKPEPTTANSSKGWQKTHFANLIRYVPSGTYFARLRVAGKLIRRSLKTDSLSVAKLRRADFEKAECEAVSRQGQAAKGKMSFGEAPAVYRTQSEASPLLKSLAKKYRLEITAAIVKYWPGVEAMDIRRIGENDCREWALRFVNEYSATRYNAALGIVKAIFNVAMAAGALYRNPALGMKRAKIRPRVLTLPDSNQFEAFVTAMENGGGRDSRNCADMVRFLVYGGLRKSEAASVTWADCEFDKGEITVRGDPITGTKNWTIRRVPMILEMRGWLERLRAERQGEPAETPVMRVRECQKAMDRAANLVGMARITHHDLRHLFATRCIESGVDIPTVSRWLGHKDGGALAMRVYGHLRDQHSAAMAQRVRFSASSAAEHQQANEQQQVGETGKAG